MVNAVKSRIPPELLNGSVIDFAIEQQGMFISGTGTLPAFREVDGGDYVELNYKVGKITCRVWLTQEKVDRIRQRPSDGRFILAAVL